MSDAPRASGANDPVGEKTIYWHRELPPIDAESVGEHTIEASSKRVLDRIENREELWRSCYEDLMRAFSERLPQEMARLGGDCAHVLDEAIDTRHDSVSGEAWLHGRFTYVLYRRPKAPGLPPGAAAIKAAGRD